MNLRTWRDRGLDLLSRPAWVMSLLALLLATQVLPLWNPTPDGAGYLSIARSMARGGPVTNMGSPKLHYPPGYPLLASPLFWLSDRPLVGLLFLQWLCAVAFMIGVYRWGRLWFAGGELWITALAMANVVLWIHARSTLSELPFMALLVWTANAMDQLISAEDDHQHFYGKILLVAALTTALALIRPVGVLVVCGYSIAIGRQAWQGRISWPRALLSVLAIGAPAAAITLALVVYESQMAKTPGARGQATYLHEFKVDDVSVAAQLVEGVRVRASEIGRLVVPGMFKAYARPYQWRNVNMYVYLPIVCGVLWAWWRLASTCPSALWLTFPWYLALYIAYPSDQGARYLLPLLPILAACLWWLVSRVPRQRVAILTILVAGHLTVAMIYSGLQTARLIKINTQWPAVDALAKVIDRDQPPSIAMWQGTEEDRELMMVAADRYVDGPVRDGQIPEKVDLLLADADAPDCPGFAEQARAGRLKLLVRSDRLARVPTDSQAP